MEIRSFYSTLCEKEGDVNALPSRTQQQFVDSCDINQILDSFNTTGIINGPCPPDSSRVPEFLDLASVPDNLQEAYEVAASAQRNFDSLPLEVRQRFNFDPSSFLNFAANPDNFDSLVDMGLATRRENFKSEENVRKTNKNTESEKKDE